VVSPLRILPLHHWLLLRGPLFWAQRAELAESAEWGDSSEIRSIHRNHRNCGIR